MNHFLFCRKCDRDFDRIGKGGSNTFICWCSECEHTYIITIHDYGSDPMQTRFEELREGKV